MSEAMLCILWLTYSEKNESRNNIWCGDRIQPVSFQPPLLIQEALWAKLPPQASNTILWKLKRPNDFFFSTLALHGKRYKILKE
jgi:hypothetical protein